MTRRSSRVVSFAAMVALTAGLTGACSSDDTPSEAASNERSCDATSVAKKVLPSVVTILVKGENASVGSGSVIRSDGSILTNNHVVSSGVEGGTLQVLFSNGTVAPASITGRDPQTDIAVVKVTGSSLPVIPYGKSSSVEIGEPVVALGAPLGLASTVTAGIVSALGRSVTVPGDDGHTAVLLSSVQTDAAINPGNSGGVLADCNGALIGVPSAIATIPEESGTPSSGDIGLGFAIPVDLAKAASDEIIATGSVTHSYLGLEVTLAPPAAQESGKSAGLYVTAVAAGGPAATAGLVAGDVITEVEGKPADATELALLTVTKKPGETAAVTYRRGETTASATITLGTPP
jgi:putative serine protease PepD